MATPHGESVQSRLETLIALSRLLDRIEASGRGIGADQYLLVVRQLQAALRAGVPEPAMEAILSAHHGAAELYENMNYERSGLSRSPLERSVSTELVAAQAIARAARRGDDH